MPSIDRDRIRKAWQGRVSGCQLGKAVEGLSMRGGYDALSGYLEEGGALPLRDYVPYREGPQVYQKSCRGHITRSEPDDDINYSVLALMMLERRGLDLTTEDVGRAWLRLLPAGAVWTAERAAYLTMLQRAPDAFSYGAAPDFDIKECADNPFNDWIGAQIRADVYGWVCPGRPEPAADLARRDAALSHQGDGIHGAAFVAALGAAIPTSATLDEAVGVAGGEVPGDSRAADAIALGRAVAGKPDAVASLHERYADLSPVHVLNNLALVVWALLSHPDDFSAAIGDAVAAGWDTDCNGATVGALWGLTGGKIPSHWTDPWRETVAVSLAGIGELALDDLVDRTVAVAERIGEAIE